MRRIIIPIILLVLFAGAPGLLVAMPDPAPVLLDTTASPVEGKTFADLLWVMVAGFLVFFMQAGFALVETGFTRAKNVTNIMMKNLMDFGLGTIVFWACGFGLMYGTDMFGLFGTSNFFLSEAVTPSGELDAWLYGYWFFQAVFAATAATIVSGAVAERTKFSAYIIYTVIITAFIYPIVGHWIWGGGWLEKLGFYDFAGSTVVHGVGAWAGLAGTMILGPRIGRFARGKVTNIPGHSMALGTLGVFILWLGWFGFNPGSTLGADLSIARIAVTTNLAAAGGAVTTMAVVWYRRGKPDLTYTLNGALAGLVAITAGCAVVSPVSALIIGSIGGLSMMLGMYLLEKNGIDDPVGAIPVHGFAGVWGTLAVGFFAQSPYTTELTGLFFGGSFTQLLVQALGIFSVFAWTIGTAYLVFKGIEQFHDLRVSAEEELNGLDKYEHGVRGYPDFFGVNDAREMMDLDAEQELNLINNAILPVDVDPDS
ncbi:ammonium transporter [Halalkalibaculum sp. DA384]|uniref:ammonium transporter n=1 Tax=Halalkalibaculum sp. DA384 TaxID=3373606 RepID=UPI003754AE91